MNHKLIITGLQAELETLKAELDKAIQKHASLESRYDAEVTAVARACGRVHAEDVARLNQELTDLQKEFSEYRFLVEREKNLAEVPHSDLFDGVDGIDAEKYFNDNGFKPPVSYNKDEPVVKPKRKPKPAVKAKYNRDVNGGGIRLAELDFEEKEWMTVPFIEQADSEPLVKTKKVKSAAFDAGKPKKPKPAVKVAKK